ncbi:hypothetical protein GLYMA_03G133900v4 [Glycine max]|uniref:Rho termination factor-like N-terminal domain-containing protein n=1 Tax=Glycine max TaxID=3847 RepID=A0A0R0KIK3_SOYBN|nr:uncharacterized protein LOC102666817 isoform X5 [Glycine max]KAH1069821.1 hypothetical protein GYH30_007128 [Glycine max]KAH1069822.1 hypothetical protein GYH30_007128 [Glycine max]KRH66871.1 hypothetical protein GLYMA_03G133900v4 [Glycine max]KRH66872.1 hypothetical protein GLYMA_03G133900v4 [Glycine max]
MAWDLWSSSYAQVASGSNYWSQHPECDFYFGCGRDFIEEDALNVESCVRVLRILITKADTEIEELERDLLLLQNELACTEHEKWPDICCAALTERISRLDVAVSTLKNDYADDAEMQPLLDKEPAETLNEILAQSLDMNMLSPIVNVTGHALDKDSSTFDSNIIIKEEEKELHGTSESSELLLELHEKRSDNPEKIEKESEFVKEKDVSSDDFRPAIGVKGRKEYPHSRLATSQQQKSGPESPDHSDWMKLSETSDKVSGNEVERSQLIDTDIGQILDLFSAKDNENIPNEAKKENEFVKEDVSSDDFRPATDIKGRKKYPNSRLATSQRKSRNSNLDKKVCDFAPETAQRAYKKQSKVAPDEDLNSVDLPLQVVYPQTFCSADTEFCSFKGSNGIQTKSTLNTDLQMIDEDEEEQEAQDLKSQITSEFRKLNMSFPSKLKAREKQKLELEAFSSREPYDSCTEVIPSTPIIVSTKRQRRSKPCTDVAILNEPMNRKIITRRAVQPDKHETEGRALVPYDSNFSELQKRRKALKLPITVDMETNSDRVSMDSRSQLVLHSSNLHSLVDSHDGASSLLPGDLNSLSLIDLRAMAKDHKVKQYYKLRKGALVEQLAKQLSSC